ncbi:MAG: alpha-ketoacid dehydrogenase subunit beta [Meiothermus sp.]|uniref:alpha-ketoacid dehydrogenase subunit beta n=1 Tax=Meiothermus sp. TaxID=1955249 RepID=UPI0025D98E26|nr:alpha-ketoacid dehydrogenase subunit beta [Meiothermus sp.]MCS7058922.1 alpha-ketoacid dehydrogenase subunit beta [Meiothermus sp.]MCS7193493.1 alpha-ketoacid dehydrogenase subunit beta [Meiothermus sp.]MCX7741505.1 alpha-ketoacid dehydrogenase subunit beta [Meiothermus sp.]MDW8090113.1 alpha-ketoacid dehydrogenase subunit beta [Meiothermus sp.]MDW8481417.1 alpha-ketoacid dehydrogenase subunit beta [Meiothermus sp.]
MIAERQTRVLNNVQAINEALDLALERDPRVVLFGEDVGTMGGVFRASDGLQQKYGEQRVFDTPLAESGIVGFGIGLAMAGLRPVAEIQFAGFLYPALDQILSHLGRMRHRTRGRFTIPMVVRAPYGGGVKTPEQHADSPEAILAHVPGVKVVIPSSPERAKGLLLAAIEDPDPVFFLEAIKLYRGVKAPVPEGYYTLPLGKARVVREGNAASLFCYGGMVEVCLKAAEVAAREGVELEVVDLETLVPLDTETILASVRKTGRAVVVYEAMRTCGFGAEVAARIAEEALDYLQAPIVRVAGWDAPYPPFSAVEHYYRPDAKRVLEAVRRVLTH